MVVSGTVVVVVVSGTVVVEDVVVSGTVVVVVVFGTVVVVVVLETVVVVVETSTNSDVGVEDVISSGRVDNASKLLNTINPVPEIKDKIKINIYLLNIIQV